MRRIMLAVVSVGIWGHAEASVLCQKKNGALFVREQCKGIETRVDPAVLGLQGPAGPKGDSGKPGPGAVVKDATGAILGVVGDTGCASFENCADGVKTLIDVDGVPVLVSVLPSAIRGTHIEIFDEVDAVYYESSDCSGSPPLLTFTGQLLFRRSSVVGSTVYYDAEDSTPYAAQSKKNGLELTTKISVSRTEASSSSRIFVVTLSFIPRRFLSAPSLLT